MVATLGVNRRENHSLLKSCMKFSGKIVTVLGPQLALHYLLDNIFIRFGSKLYRQTVGIPMYTNCAPIVADLFLFCYERDFMLSLSDNNQTAIIEAFPANTKTF